VLLNISDSTVATWMGTVSTLFFPKNSPTAVKAVTIREIDDRPSTYIFEEFRRKKDRALLSANARKKRNMTFEGLRAIVDLKGASFSTRILNTPHPPEDFENFVELRSFNVVMLEFQPRNDSILDLGQSGTLISRSLEQLERAFNWDSPAAKVISNSLLKINCPIGLLIDKKHPGGNKLERVLFVYTGREYESLAIGLLKQLIVDSDISITVATTTNSFSDTYSIDPEKVSIKEIKMPIDDNSEIWEQISKHGYDLIIWGAERGGDEIFKLPVVSGHTTPVLLLYPGRKESMEVEDPA